MPESKREKRPRKLDDPGLKRWKRLLTKADQDPSSVLEDTRCLKPRFIDAFFDLCDGKALEVPPLAPEYAQAAMQLAIKTGDRHLMVRAAGIAAHACIGNGAWDEAGKLLETYREAALGCCTACASDWLRRQGDLLGETRDSERAREVLERSAEILGKDLDDDTRARILFVRAVAHFGLEDVEQALADVGEALLLLDLSSPRGYFMDAIAFLACFVEHSYEVERRLELEHYQTALGHLARFRRRLTGLKHWNEVRDRLRWVRGQLEACLGNYPAARPLLERARQNHAKHSPHRYALAIGLDEALIYCRNMPETYIRSVQRILGWCDAHLNPEPDLAARLEEAIEEIREEPYRARSILWDLRASYVVPVPCLVADLPSAMQLRDCGDDEEDQDGETGMAS